MALWLVRAGKHGEHEPRFFQDKRIYLTHGGAPAVNLSQAPDYDSVRQLVGQHNPTESKARLGNWAGQIWAFALPMAAMDWVVTPLKTKAAIAVGEVTGPYNYTPLAEKPYC